MPTRPTARRGLVRRMVLVLGLLMASTLALQPAQALPVPEPALCAAPDPAVAYCIDPPGDDRTSADVAVRTGTADANARLARDQATGVPRMDASGGLVVSDPLLGAPVRVDVLVLCEGPGPVRACQDGQGAVAAGAAGERAGVAWYPQGTLFRVCGAGTLGGGICLPSPRP